MKNLINILVLIAVLALLFLALLISGSQTKIAPKMIGLTATSASLARVTGGPVRGAEVRVFPGSEAGPECYSERTGTPEADGFF